MTRLMLIIGVFQNYWKLSTLPVAQAPSGHVPAPRLLVFLNVVISIGAERVSVWIEVWQGENLQTHSHGTVRTQG